MGRGYQIWNACAVYYATVRVGSWSGVLGLSEDDSRPRSYPDNALGKVKEMTDGLGGSRW